MPPVQIPIDGLWRCLCPSINVIAISSPLRTPITRRRLLPSQQHVPRTIRPHARSLHTTPRHRSEQPTASQDIDALQQNTNPVTEEEHSLGPTYLASLQRKKYGERVNGYSVAELHDHLRVLRVKSGSYHEIAALVEYLCSIRGDKPAIIHYDSLIRANAHAMPGSAAVVRDLLEEMKSLGIAPDSGVYHSALQVLAIHPDYLLRNEIMQDMKERWLGLSPEGWHSLVTGLIRDRQYEVAMDKLEEMRSDEIVVQPWLYDIFTFKLCDAGELDEAFNLLKYRFETTRRDIQPSVWYYMFDAFSSAFHYEGVKYIWERRVETSDITLSDGMCVTALNLAARYYDTELATSAIRILSGRRSALASFHYEALLAAYTGSQGFKTAFRILNIMTKANLELTPNTTRPLFLALCRSPEFPRQAWAVLEELCDDEQTVPVAAVNVVLEATIAVGRFEEAVDLYKKLYQVCKSGPSTETFNVLLQGANHGHRKALSMFLASEMRALGIPANQLTYDRLILACIPEDDYEDAFRYLEEMITAGADKSEGGWWMRVGTVGSLIRRCVDSNDERAWDLLDEMRRRGMNDVKSRDWAQIHWRGKRREREFVEQATTRDKLNQWASM